MDTTMPAVMGTGLTTIGTGLALFVALWRVPESRFGTLERHIDRRFEAVDQRLEGVDRRWTGRLEAVERQGRAAHAAVCALNGRFDHLYRHLLGAPAEGGQAGPAPAAG